MNRIGELVSGRPVLSSRTEWTVKEAARYMTENKVGAVPVLDGDRLVGIFSERDLMSRVVVPGKDPERVLVKEVMTKSPITAHPDDNTQLCLRKMQQAQCRHLPVVIGNKLIGTISLRELMQVNLEEKVVEIQAMTEYIQHNPS